MGKIEVIRRTFAKIHEVSGIKFNVFSSTPLLSVQYIISNVVDKQMVSQQNFHHQQLHGPCYIFISDLLPDFQFS